MAQGEGMALAAERKSFAPAFLVLALLTHLPAFLGPWGLVDFYDTVEVHSAHFRRMAELFSTFGPFTWYPFSFGGQPAFAGQHPPYALPVLLSGVAPFWLLSSAWSMGMTFVAGWGMQALLERLVGAERRLALLLGALFALGFVHGNVHFVYAYCFPAMAVLTLEAFDPRTCRVGRGLRMAALLLLALASYPVLTLPHYPVFHLALVLVFARARADFRRQVAGVFAVWTAYVLLFAPSIWSLYEYIPYAQRDWAFAKVGLWQGLASYALALKSRITECALFPLLLPSAWLLRKDGRGRAAMALTLIPFLVACVFGSDLKNALAGSFLVKMDLFLSSMVALCGAYALVALALGRLSRERAAMKPFFFAAFACCLLRRGEYAVLSGLLLAAATWLGVLLSSSAFRAGLRSRAACVGLAVSLAGVAMMTAQQYIASSSVFPAAPFSNMSALRELAARPEAAHARVACIDLHPALVQAYGLDTVGGKGPLFNRQFKELAREAVAPQLATPKLREGFTTVWRQLYLTRFQADHDQRPLVLKGPVRRAADFDLPLLRALGVRYLVSARPMEGIEGEAVLIASERPNSGPLAGVFGPSVSEAFAPACYVYELRGALPYGRFVAPLAPAPGETVLSRLAGADDATLRTRAVIMAEDAAALPEALRLAGAASHDAGEVRGSARLVSWSPDRREFEGTAAGPGLLLLPENFDARWTANVNGASARVIRADHAFLATPVDAAGPFRVVFEYRSPLLWRLHLASLAGLVLFAAPLLLRVEAGAKLVRLAQPGVRPRHLGRCVAFGLLLSLVWGAGFLFFVLLKKSAPDLTQAMNMRYTLLCGALLGPAVSGWAAYVCGAFWGSRR